MSTAPVRYQVRLKASGSTNGSASGEDPTSSSSSGDRSGFFSFGAPGRRLPSNATWWYSPQALRPRSGNPKQCLEDLQAAIKTVEALPTSGGASVSASGGSDSSSSSSSGGGGDGSAGEKKRPGKKVAARLARAQEVQTSLAEATLAAAVQEANEQVAQAEAFEAGDASAAALEAGTACETALKQLKEATALAEGKGANGAMAVR